MPFNRIQTSPLRQAEGGHSLCVGSYTGKDTRHNLVAACTSRASRISCEIASSQFAMEMCRCALRVTIAMSTAAATPSGKLGI